MQDRKISISIAGSRFARSWQQSEMWWSELVQKLKVPVRSAETLEQFLRLPKSKQDNLKDVGGYVGGKLKDGQRKAANVVHRDIIALDFDNIPAGMTVDVLQRLTLLGCAYVVHSTRKHEENRPRLRVLLPLSRSVSAEEYEPIARKLAENINMAWTDPTTFQAPRLMYWPSCSSDSRYVFEEGKGSLLDADGILALYTDWHDHSRWATAPTEAAVITKLADRQQDPMEKAGIVGAYCRLYSMQDVLFQVLEGVYTQTVHHDRLTYTGGSTHGGAVLYEDKWLYSHHATDPACGRLCNAWDLVRIHKFGYMDDEADINTPANRLPSYLAMSEYAIKDERVRTALMKERYESAAGDFNREDAGDAKEIESDWLQKIKVNSNGVVEKTIDNVLIVLEHDPLLADKIKFDEFAGRVVTEGRLPWSEEESRRNWDDNDDAGLRHYLERVYTLSGKDKIYDATSLCAMRRAHNPIKDYLLSLAWDGKERVDRLFIDYLGAGDTAYNRAVARKSLTAAVARVMQPGIKYDNMPILVGAQGIGKSTMLRILGKDWFSDSLTTFEGKEAAETIRGTWINEIGELNALSKSESGAVKMFLSKSHDIYREAYGKRSGCFKRRCVFFGTTNESEFLRDPTGARRFWPVDLGEIEPIKSVFEDLPPEVDQIWAEAFVFWQLGEPLFIGKDLAKEALAAQEAHREVSGKLGAILDFLCADIPTDWYKRDLNSRLEYISFGHSTYKGELMKRDRICVAEIWTECFGKKIGDLRRMDSSEITGVLRGIKGLTESNSNIRFGCHGRQKGFAISRNLFEQNAD